MKVSQLTLRRVGILMLGMLAVQFLMMLIGDFETHYSAAIYWTVMSFLMIVGSRWAGFMPTLLAYLIVTFLGSYMGVFAGIGYVVYLGFGAAVYITLVTANLRRSPIWGVLIAGIVRFGYLWMMFSVLLPNMSPDMEVSALLLTGLYGWPLWVGSVVGGIAALPILFRFHIIETATEMAQLAGPSETKKKNEKSSPQEETEA